MLPTASATLGTQLVGDWCCRVHHTASTMHAIRRATEATTAHTVTATRPYATSMTTNHRLPRRLDPAIA